VEAIAVNNFYAKSDPRDPKTSSPDYDECVRVGAKRWEKMKDGFESEGAKRDYLKQVASNPNNVLGLPPTFPPLNKQYGVTGFIFGGDGIGMEQVDEILPCGHTWTIKGYRHNGEQFSRCSYGHEFSNKEAV